MVSARIRFNNYTPHHFKVSFQGGCDGYGSSHNEHNYGAKVPPNSKNPDYAEMKCKVGWFGVNQGVGGIFDMDMYAPGPGKSLGKYIRIKYTCPASGDGYFNITHNSTPYKVCVNYEGKVSGFHTCWVHVGTKDSVTSCTLKDGTLRTFEHVPIVAYGISAGHAAAGNKKAAERAAVTGTSAAVVAGTAVATGGSSLAVMAGAAAAAGAGTRMIERGYNEAQSAEGRTDAGRMRDFSLAQEFGAMAFDAGGAAFGGAMGGAGGGAGAAGASAAESAAAKSALRTASETVAKETLKAGGKTMLGDVGIEQFNKRGKAMGRGSHVITAAHPHTLKWTDGSDSYKTFGCDLCHRTYKGQRFWCSACQFDCCNSCAFKGESISMLQHPHLLRWEDGTRAYKAFICNLCRKHTSEPRYFCAHCKWDTCKACTDAALLGKIKIPHHAHYLKVTNRDKSWFCDVCKNRAPKGRYRCNSGCDWDACNNCVHNACA